MRNDHPKLTVTPTVVVPPEVKLQANNTLNLGNPTAPMPSGPPSNGTGSGGGIGSGSGGGIGVGAGPGVGEGRGGGIGGNVFRIGGGVSGPKAIYEPDPEYSEEARKAKYQGTVVLSIIVGADGVPRDIKMRSVGWAWMKRPSKREDLEVRSGNERWQAGSDLRNHRSRIPSLLIFLRAKSAGPDFGQALNFFAELFF